MSTIGERLKEIRKASGLSQTRFAALGGVGKHSQINYEAGDSSPDARYLSAIAAAGYDVVYVITGGSQFSSTSPCMVEENLPAPYSPAEEAAVAISVLKLSIEDAQIIINLAKRLASR